MKAPAFWFTPPHRPDLRARLLAPLAALRARALARRRAACVRWTAPVPVICVGSLTTAGSGKAQAVLAVVGHLQAMGHKPAILCRGTGGRSSRPVTVDVQKHTQADVSDRALLTAAFAPTWISRDRRQGAEALLAVTPTGGGQTDCIVIDDGLQELHVFNDISVIVVDAALGFGNGRSFPAGPLHEPLASGLNRADLVLSIGSDAAQSVFERTWGAGVTCPRIRGRLELLETGMDWRGARLVAFAGIGDSEIFFAALRGLGADLVHCAALEERHPPGAALIARLEREAASRGAQLVTTELDAVRRAPEIRRKVLTLPLRLQVAEWEPFDAALARIGLTAGCAVTAVTPPVFPR